MFHGIVPFALVTLNFLCASTRGDTVIYCDVKESCILPCSFQAGEEEVIHWMQEKTSVSAHSYYYKKDQLTLQSPQFKGRTSLFLDQLSKGNASLQLKEVGVQDEGRYKCYTSTLAGHDQTYVQLHVDAPVNKIYIHRTGDTITCSSEGIYPEPQLTWSTQSSVDPDPGNTTVQPNEQKLYDIKSSLNRASDDQMVSCTIQTRKNKRRITMNKPSAQDGETNAKLTCTLPAPTETNLVWSFNQSEDVVRRDSNKKSEVSSKWEKHFVDLSASGTLTLKDLTEKESGLYSCEASNSEETLISDTLLKVAKNLGTSSSNAGAIIGTVIAALVAVVVLVCIFYWCLRGKRNKRKKTGT